MLSFVLGTHVACPEIPCVFLSSGSRARRIWLGTDLDPRTACRPAGAVLPGALLVDW